jgi:hypothetical protein
MREPKRRESIRGNYATLFQWNMAEILFSAVDERALGHAMEDLLDYSGNFGILTSEA